MAAPHSCGPPFAAVTDGAICFLSLTLACKDPTLAPDPRTGYTVTVRVLLQRPLPHHLSFSPVSLHAHGCADLPAASSELLPFLRYSSVQPCVYGPILVDCVSRFSTARHLLLLSYCHSMFKYITRVLCDLILLCAPPITLPRVDTAPDCPSSAEKQQSINNPGDQQGSV